jgi:hypothetical protein
MHPLARQLKVRRRCLPERFGDVLLIIVAIESRGPGSRKREHLGLAGFWTN